MEKETMNEIMKKGFASFFKNEKSLVKKNKQRDWTGKSILALDKLRSCKGKGKSCQLCRNPAVKKVVEFEGSEWFLCDTCFEKKKQEFMFEKPKEKEMDF